LQQFPKVLEFLFLLEGWAVNDEMVLFTMETTRLRGDLVRSRPWWMRLAPVTFCSFVMMRMSLMVMGSGVLMAFQVGGALSSLLRCCGRCGSV